MASFAKAVDTVTNKTLTENGAVVEATTNSPLLDFSHKVVRGTTSDEIKTRISQIMTHVEKTNDMEALTDLFILMFHKRNPRGGEGEKEIVYNMFLELYEYYPRTVKAMLRLFGEFGYYKDLFQIWEKVWKLVEKETNGLTGQTRRDSVKFYKSKYDNLITEIVQHTIQQRNSDLKSLRENKPISLVGKFIPNQNGHFSKHAFWYIEDNDGMYHKKRCTELLIHHLAFQAGVKLDFGRKIPSFWFQKYRTGNSLLNKKLDVPEIHMASNNFANIKIEQMASRALSKYRKALLNEKVKTPPKPYEEEKGNRFPDKADRVEARQNFKKLLDGKAAEKLKSAGLDPHDILEKAISSTVSTTELKALVALWEAKKLDVHKHFQEVIDNLKAIGQELTTESGPGRVIPMVDVSESMNTGSPNALSVAVALGIMTAELHPENSPFRDTLISFTDIPTVFKFKSTDTLVDRRNKIHKHKGYNTNFRLAMEELLGMCLKNKVAEADIPDILVFTDGQFDMWGSSYNVNGKVQWKTQHEELMKMWGASGYTKIPRIIYWNLRGGTPGVQTSADHPGVQMLQGFSPNLIKFVLYGESFGEKTQDVEINGKVIKMKVSQVTPWDTFRTIVDQSKYDIVRVILDSSDEKMLSQYHYQYNETKLSNTEKVNDTKLTDDYEVV